MTGGGRDRKGGGEGRVRKGYEVEGRVVSLGNSVICTGDPPRLHSLDQTHSALQNTIHVKRSFSRRIA
jgi:hypothetical protein